MGRKRGRGGDLLPGYEGVGKRKEKENPNRKESGKKEERLKCPEKGSGSLSATLFLVRCWFFCDLPLGRGERLSPPLPFAAVAPPPPLVNPFSLSFFLFRGRGGVQKSCGGKRGAKVGGGGASLREAWQLSACTQPTHQVERTQTTRRPPAAPATLVYAIPPSLPPVALPPAEKRARCALF